MSNSRFFLLFSIALVLSSSLFGCTAKKVSHVNAAQIDIEKLNPTSPEMKKWQEYATPSSGHKVLDSYIGEWQHEVTWWQSPGGKMTKSSGTSRYEWIMGGRYIKQIVRGDPDGSHNFKGLGFIGFDNLKERYESVWLDNMGTGLMKAEGSFDEKTKQLTETGFYSDPVNGETKFRGVTTFVDAKKYNYKLYTPDKEGKEFLTMKINYVRVD